jgi:hypothetical protein
MTMAAGLAAASAARAVLCWRLVQGAIRLTAGLHCAHGGCNNGYLWPWLLLTRSRAISLSLVVPVYQTGESFKCTDGAGLHLIKHAAVGKIKSVGTGLRGLLAAPWMTFYPPTVHVNR